MFVNLSGTGVQASDIGRATLLCGQRRAGGLASLFHLTLLQSQSTASLTPVPVRALKGRTLLSLTLPPFSPSTILRTKPSLIRTTSTQSSRSCLLARTRRGTPSVSPFCKMLSSTSLHSSSLPCSSTASWPLLRCSMSPSPTSVLSMTKTMAWQLL